MQDIHDIKGPLELSFNYWPLLILFTVFVLVLLILLYLSLRRRPKLPPPEEAPAVIRVSARDIALHELEKVKKERLIELNKSELFYNRITGILKQYLTEQYNTDVDSKTSTEIIIQLKTMQLDYDFVRQVELCLKDFDFAKYSSYKTAARDMTESFDLIYALLKLENKLSLK